MTNTIDRIKLCLDFANTADWHASANPQEQIHDYSELVAWARKSGILDGNQARQVRDLAQAEPEQAQQVYKAAIKYREIFYRIFSAVAADTEPESDDMASLNDLLADYDGYFQITPASNGFRWSPTGRVSLNLITANILLSGIEFLTSDLIRRVGKCADERGCGWLFLDMSKNRSRRWCDMKDCGNRNKVRRYYAKKKN